jgi:hypothetical protein
MASSWTVIASSNSTKVYIPVLVTVKVEDTREILLLPRLRLQRTTLNMSGSPFTNIKGYKSLKAPCKCDILLYCRMIASDCYLSIICSAFIDSGAVCVRQRG